MIYDLNHAFPCLMQLEGDGTFMMEGVNTTAMVEALTKSGHLQ